MLGTRTDKRVQHLDDETPVPQTLGLTPPRTLSDPSWIIGPRPERQTNLVYSNGRHSLGSGLVGVGSGKNPGVLGASGWTLYRIWHGTTPPRVTPRGIWTLVNLIAMEFGFIFVQHRND